MVEAAATGVGGSRRDRNKGHVCHRRVCLPCGKVDGCQERAGQGPGKFGNSMILESVKDMAYRPVIVERACDRYVEAGGQFTQISTAPQTRLGREIAAAGIAQDYAGHLATRARTPEDQIGDVAHEIEHWSSLGEASIGD